MVVNDFAQSLKALLAKFSLDAPDVRIQGLTLDSREVNVHTAFVAVRGHHQDGRDFIPQAISLGARAILSETDDIQEHGKVTMREQTVIVELFELNKLLSALAAAFYDYPANKMSTVAVTGTNGKTSTVQLLSQMKDALGTKCASIGTLGAGLFHPHNENMSPTRHGNTTPDAIKMQYLLAQFAQQEVRHVAFEASSHALVQGRLDKVNTDIAVFTNLSRDHLDYHGDMAAYGRAKRLLLEQPGLKTLVLNQDDSQSKLWREHCADHIHVVWTSVTQCHSVKPQDRYCFATNVQYHSSGCQFRLSSSWGTNVVNIPLLGEFNIANLLSALAVLLAQGERFENVVRVMEQVCPVDGRMEVFPIDQHANIVVDYAHTPDALAQALLAVRAHTEGKVWCVFGCGGDRDKGKRPLMAKAAEQYADYLVITTDNSRSETPHSIAADMREGLSDKAVVVEEPDREAAIRYCLSKADEDDLILVAGKGHENYQIINNEKRDYNERAVIARLQQEFAQ